MLTTNAKYKLGSKLVPKEDSLKASRQGPGELRRPWGVLKGLKLKVSSSRLRQKFPGQLLRL